MELGTRWKKSVQDSGPHPVGKLETLGPATLIALWFLLVGSHVSFRI